MNIDEMQAGREMDEVLGKALGVEPKKDWNVLNTDETATAFCGESRREVENFLTEHLKRNPDSWLKDYHVGYWEFYKKYSTDIAAAWEVVNKLQPDYFVNVINGRMEGEKDGVLGVDVEIGRYGTFGEDIVSDVCAETAPLAICRAALKALGVEA